MEHTIEEQLRILFRRVGEAESSIKALAGDVRSAGQIVNELDGLAARLRDIELGAATTLPLAATKADEDDGQWGVGDIILAAEKVETRKASKRGESPVVCAWFDDPAQARSLAQFVGAEVRFDEFTNWLSVTFEATRVI